MGRAFPLRRIGPAPAVAPSPPFIPAIFFEVSGLSGPRIWYRRRGKIGCIEIIFPGHPDQREKSVASSIGECCSHPLRRRGFADRADRPIR